LLNDGFLDLAFAKASHKQSLSHLFNTALNLST